MNTNLNQNPKEPCLYHYTSEFHFLQQMLREGIWPRYCIEDFGWLLGSNIYIAIPMACFCDIPLHAAGEHRNRYGYYAISLSKSCASDLDINPVWYLQEGTTLVERLKECCATRALGSIDAIPATLKMMIPYLKPTIGAQPDRKALRNGTTEIMAFEEEMEWRYSPLSLIDTWSFGCGRKSLEPLKHESSLSHRIAPPSNLVEQVFVTSASEKAQLEREFPWLAGRVKIWQEE